MVICDVNHVIDFCKESYLPSSINNSTLSLLRDPYREHFGPYLQAYQLQVALVINPSLCMQLSMLTSEFSAISR